MAVLDAIKDDGTYAPLVMGTSDQWEAATMGFQNIGPNYWKGEEGRQALIKGTAEVHRCAVRPDLEGPGRVGAIPADGLSRR